MFRILVLLFALLFQNLFSPSFAVTEAQESEPAAESAPNQVAATTLEVDFARRPQHIKKSMMGVVNGNGNGPLPHPYLTAGVNPRQWRLAWYNIPLYQRIKSYPDQINFGLMRTVDGRYPHESAAAMADFKDHVLRLANMLKNEPKIMWNPWNEPDIRGFFPKHEGWEADYFETFRQAYNVLKSVDSNAIITGPCIAHWDVPFVRRFLQYCQNHNMKIDILTWHENGGAQNDRQDVREARYLAAAFPRVGIRSFHVNEYGSPTHEYVPAAALAHVHELEYAGIDAACRSCWSDPCNDCWNNTLNGLLTQSLAPRAIWHAYRAYAVGLPSRVISRSSNQFVYSLSNKANGNVPPQVLMAYYEGSGHNNRVFTTRIDLQLKNLGSAGLRGSGNKLKLVIKRCPPNFKEAQDVPMHDLPARVVPIQNGSATVSFPEFKRHDLYIMSLSRTQ